MIGADPEHCLRWKLGGWGSLGRNFFEPEAMAEYLRCFKNPATVHALCEDYRASAGIDPTHDRDSRSEGQKLACELLVLCGTRGVIHALFDPLVLWQAQCAARVHPQALESGHYLAEEQPDEVAARLRAHFSRAPAAA